MVKRRTGGPLRDKRERNLGADSGVGEGLTVGEFSAGVEQRAAAYSPEHVRHCGVRGHVERDDILPQGSRDEDRAPRALHVREVPALGGLGGCAELVDAAPHLAPVGQLQLAVLLVGTQYFGNQPVLLHRPARDLDRAADHQRGGAGLLLRQPWRVPGSIARVRESCQ
eukprot:TRINITY_DN12655_c0_g1_i2.p1 TRINITY_DN12655_c0_g1~~TRINITY_DN12655_c0_g1_i2.p1  ORF type:complete len:168 (-),score=4.66 TRINITY_DN12655_c0_g1_i2:23-526(-)